MPKFALVVSKIHQPGPVLSRRRPRPPRRIIVSRAITTRLPLYGRSRRERCSEKLQEDEPTSAPRIMPLTTPSPCCRLISASRFSQHGRATFGAVMYVNAEQREFCLQER
eukprot:4130437-Prymnesium_polylepis.1